MIDKQLELLYKREKNCISNRNVVEYKIRKLLFQLEGEMKVRYLKEGK